MILTNNRGMFLESLINYTIEYYKNNAICLIYKRPVDVVCTKSDGARIISGYFKAKSTCDYYGVYNGTYLEFEAKETQQEKFALANLAAHQLAQLQLVHQHNGISFLLVYFANANRYFILPMAALDKFISTNKFKQIPILYFIEKGYELYVSYPGILDFKKELNRLVS